MRILLVAIGALSLIAGAPPHARAELPAIRLDRLTPLGAAAGTTVEVETAGRDTEDANTLAFDRPGITAEFVQAGRFRVTVAADVPEGTYDARLVGRFGVSNPRLFAVSHGLADVREQEPNNTAAEAQPVPLDAAVYGSSDQNNEDAYRFAARQGQRVVIACEAEKLDSEMDATLYLADAAGSILAASADYYGRDPLVDFVAPANGEYVAHVHDLSYRGGFPYRLLVTTRPHVENVFPRAVSPGQEVDLVALGRNFSPAAAAYGPADGPALEEFRSRFTPPSDPAAHYAYQFFEHPTDHAVLPTAATDTLNGFQWSPPIAGGALRPQVLLWSDAPVTVEVESNNDQSQPQGITLPATVSGRFDQPRDADWYEFEAPADGPCAVDVYSERIAGRADPYVVIVDDQGNRIQEFDDFGQRIDAFDGHLRDPVGTIGLAAGRKYRLLVQDRYQRGGPRYQYVLTVHRAAPDFFVAAIHSENPGPSGTTVWAGGAAFLDLVVHAREGYGEPIVVTAEGLPAGLHAEPTTIAADGRGTFVLWADREAPIGTGAIRLVATGRRDGQPLVREVRPYTRVWAVANVNSSRPMRELALAIREPAPYALSIEPRRITVESGKSADLRLVLRRQWADFRGSVRAIPLNFPGNFQMPELEVRAEQTEVAFSLAVQAGTRSGNYTLALLGQAQVPFNKDPQAAERPNTLVSTPSLPLTLTVVAPAAK